jgi:hypothetical protein
MVLTVSFVLFPVTGLFCHRHLAGHVPARLSASVGAPEPHDFAVRCSIIRPRNELRLTPQRPSHPAPNVRDDREPPLLRERDSENCKFDLGLRRSEIFLQRGLDRFFARLPVGQITFVSGASGSFRSLVGPARDRFSIGTLSYIVPSFERCSVQRCVALGFIDADRKAAASGCRFGPSTLVRSLGSDHLGPILVSNSIAFCRCRFAPIC